MIANLSISTKAVLQVSIITLVKTSVRGWLQS